MKTCCVPNCNSGPEERMFHFPLAISLRKEWIRRIGLDVVNVSFSKLVCIKHFEDECLEKRSGGKVFTMKGAYPTLLLDLPPSSNKERKTNTSIKQDSAQEPTGAHSKPVSFNDLTAVCEKNMDEFPKWFIQKFHERVTFFRISEESNTEILASLTIQSDFSAKAYVYGKDPSKKQKELIGLNKKSFLSSWKEIAFCLKGLTYIIHRIKPKCLSSRLNGVIGLIQNDIEEREEYDPARRKLRFVSEQLMLHNIPSNSRRYSVQLYRFGSEGSQFCKSLYKTWQHSDSVVVPAAACIRNMTLGKGTKNATFFGQRITQVQMLASQLQEYERIVMMCLEEHVNIQEEGQSPEATLYLIGISCIFSDYELAIARIQREDDVDMVSLVHERTLTVFKMLQDAGFTVVTVVSEFSPFWKKVYAKFCDLDEPIICCPHPYDEDKPLFLLYDPATLLKAIWEEWLAQTCPKETFVFPNPDSNIGMFSACVDDLRSLVVNKPQKKTLEKLVSLVQDEQKGLFLASKLFDWKNVCMLKDLAETEISNPEETLVFLEIVSRWWQVVDEKILPFDKTGMQNDHEKGTFMNFFVEWLERWLATDTQDRPSLETLEGLLHSSYCIKEIFAYLTKEFPSEKVLLGKFRLSRLKS